MRDISARELKGHNILAVERFWDNTRWMIEFSVLRPSTAYGSPGEEMRLFLTEDGYQAALQSQQRREIKIKRCGSAWGVAKFLAKPASIGLVGRAVLWRQSEAGGVS